MFYWYLRFKIKNLSKVYPENVYTYFHFFVWFEWHSFLTYIFPWFSELNASFWYLIWRNRLTINCCSIKHIYLFLWLCHLTSWFLLGILSSKTNTKHFPILFDTFVCYVLFPFVQKYLYANILYLSRSQVDNFNLS